MPQGPFGVDPELRGATVLVVDDERVVAEVAAAMLERLGFRTHVAIELEAVGRAIGDLDPDVVLAGPVPACGAPSAYVRSLRAMAWRDLPVVFWSGDPNLVEAARPHATEVLLKPPDLHELVDTVQRALRATRSPSGGAPAPTPAMRSPPGPELPDLPPGWRVVYCRFCGAPKPRPPAGAVWELAEDLPLLCDTCGQRLWDGDLREAPPPP